MDYEHHVLTPPRHGQAGYAGHGEPCMLFRASFKSKAEGMTARAAKLKDVIPNAIHVVIQGVYRCKSSRAKRQRAAQGFPANVTEAISPKAKLWENRMKERKIMNSFGHRDFAQEASSIRKLDMTLHGFCRDGPPCH